MHYIAKLSREKKYWLVDFRDCPGCHTFGSSESDALAMAAEALQGWLEAHLIDGEAPPRPKAHRGKPIRVPSSLAIALQVRWLREDRRLTQAALAKRVGVSQQQIAKLERPGGNPSLATLEKIGVALGTCVSVEFKAA